MSAIVPNQQWFSVEELGRATWAISEYGHAERVHSYLLGGSERAALIDTGLGVDDIRTIVDRLIDRPVVVVTTHSHWDHVGGHGGFEWVLVQALEADWLRNGAPLPADVVRGSRGVAAFLQGPPPGFNLASWQPHRGAATGLVGEGDRLILGSRELVIMHTPGHSPGHISVHDPTQGLLITGDLVYRGRMFASFEGADPRAFANSVHRLRGLQRVDALLPGHNEIWLDRAELADLDDGLQALAREGRMHPGSGRQDLGQFQIEL